MLLAAGCSTLRPLNLPDEYSISPAQSALWTQLTMVRPDNWLHLLNTGDEAMEWRLRLIDSASQSLDLQTFLWNDDKSGLTFLRHIYEAADRGVRVRILVDDFFTSTHDEAIWDVDQHPNIEFRIYNPYAHRDRSLGVRMFVNLGDFSRVDHRMHNKLMVVDNRAAIVGGRNLGDEYFGRHDSANFRDMEVLVAGTEVPLLSGKFDEYWNNDWAYPVDRLLRRQPAMGPQEYEAWIIETVQRGLEEDLPTLEQAWIRVAEAALAGEILVVADTPATENPAARAEFPNQLAHVLMEWMDTAKEELILVSAYLIPTPELEQTVERAEGRGVRVRILTNSLRSNNHVAAHSAYRHHIHRLVHHGAEVHEVRALAKDRALYMEDPIDKKHLGLHSKVLLIDNDISFIGSTNLDARSLKLNTEMGILIKSREFNNLVREALAIDFHHRNAWHLQMQDNGRLIWVADDVTLHNQPAESDLQRLEDWFLSILPIEGEM